MRRFKLYNSVQSFIAMGLIAGALTIGFAVSNGHAADCASVGAQVAAQRSAQLVSAVPITANGQAACQITILEPTASGPRKRVTLTVSAGS